MHDQLTEPWKELLDGLLHRVTQIVALGLPVTLREMVRRIHDEARHDMFARRSHIRVKRGLHRAIQERATADTSRLAVRPGLHQVVDRGAEVREPHEDVFTALESRERGEVGQGEIHLGCGALELEIPDVADEIAGKVIRIDESEERLARVERADDQV